MSNFRTILPRVFAVGWGMVLLLPVIDGSESLLWAQEGSLLPLESRPSAVARLAEAYHEAGQFNGSVLAAVGDEIVYRAAFGLADHEFGVPNEPGTVFRLASLTKQFTAAAVLLLVERGELDLTSPVGRYIPALDQPAWSGVTLQRVLTHTAGIPRDVEAFVAKDLGDHFKMAEMIDILAGAPLDHEPGRQYSYSNAGYVIAAAVIESVTGVPYGDAMHTLLFAPFGLDDTGHEERRMVIPHFAQGYQTLADRVLRSEYEDKSYVTGAGSVYSTVDDLFTWIRALRSGRVLGDSMANELTTKQVDPGYAYGWFAFTYGLPPSPDGKADSTRYSAVTHSGAAPGFETNIRVYLDHDITVIALSNDRRSNPQALANKIGNILLAFADTIAPSPASPAIYRIALVDGVDAALEYWNRATGEDRDMLPDENHVNLAAYDYLQAGLLAEALPLFELQVRLFPNSANAHDSLGEAYLHAGRWDEGEAAYRKAIELDPEFAHARAVLDHLERHPRDVENLP